MTANDRGHLNNLDENEKKLLKEFWKNLLKKFDNINEENIFENEYFKEFIYLFANDHPDSIVLRWIRARKWNIELALDHFMDTLKWRIESNINDLIFHGESCLSIEEIQSGKSFYFAQDKFNRPIHYVSVKDHRKGQFQNEKTEKLTMFSMEIGRKLLKYPNETVTIVFDLNQFSYENLDYQHLKFLIHVLEHYYPESLGNVLILNSSWLFTSAWYLIKQWLDPIVEQKIIFIKDFNHLSQFIDLNNVPKKFQGYANDFLYIKPSKDEFLQLKTIRDDIDGKVKLSESYQNIALQFIQITNKWIYSNDFNEQRNQGIQDLANAYTKLIPYISTKTFYHRNGLINEPIFDITYQNILTNNQQQDLIQHF